MTPKQEDTGAVFSAGLVVALATSGAGGCDGSGGGGEGGAPSTGSAATSTDATTTNDSTTTDPCPSLQCEAVAEGSMLTPSASLEGTTLRIEVTGGTGMCVSSSFESWEGVPTVTVAPELGTLADVSVSDTDHTVTVTITVGDNPGPGSVSLEGEVTNNTWICPVSRVFVVSFPDGGEPEVALLESPRPPVVQHLSDARLALLDARGTTARIGLGGAGGADVSFDVTAGTVEQHGNEAWWRLPPRPGLYQIEAVVRRGAELAIETLLVEVRPDPQLG